MPEENIPIDESNIIHSEEDFARKLKTINTQGLENKSEALRVQHTQVASLFIKIINTIKIDSFVRRVMTLRLLGPLVTGRERSHVSIALELGADVDDVIEAEKFGISIVEQVMQQFSNKDFVDKFNRDNAVKVAVVKELDKSALNMRNPKGVDNV